MLQLVFNFLITAFFISCLVRHVLGTVVRWQQYRMTEYEYKCRKKSSHL